LVWLCPFHFGTTIIGVHLITVRRAIARPDIGRRAIVLQWCVHRYTDLRVTGHLEYDLRTVIYQAYVLQTTIYRAYVLPATARPECDRQETGPVQGQYTDHARHKGLVDDVVGNSLATGEALWPAD
jgi:hypothetical protein